MSLFGLLKRPKGVTPVMRVLPPEPASMAATAEPAHDSPPTSDEVLHMLFEAMASGDRWHLDQLCREHRETIDRHAAEWMAVPVALHENAAAADWYAHGVDLLLSHVRVSSLATAV